MSKTEANGRNPAQDARRVMHEDEHAIAEVILSRALGDDDCVAKIVSGDRSESGGAEVRLVLARFLERMERQFALRAEARSDRRRRAAMIGAAPDHRPARRPLRQRIGVQG